MANETKEPRDFSVIWSAPMRCRGPWQVKAGRKVHKRCGVDLRDQMYDLLQEHGRGKTIEYKCAACGHPHTVKFPEVPEVSSAEA